MTAILAGVGILLILIGYVWFLIEAFKESVVWGLLCLFFPFVQIVFFFMHLDKAWKPTVLQIVGLVVMAMGFFALGDALANLPR